MRTRPPSRTLQRADERGYFPLTVAIHPLTETQDEFGGVTETLGDAILVDAPCRIASQSGNDEVRRPDGTIVTDARIITLKTYQPTIEPTHVAVLDESFLDQTLWDIVSVDHDGQLAFTKLVVQEVR